MKNFVTSNWEKMPVYVQLRVYSYSHIYNVIASFILSSNSDSFIPQRPNLNNFGVCFQTALKQKHKSLSESLNPPCIKTGVKFQTRKTQ